MKDHHSLLTQEPPLSPAGVPGREGQEASDTVPTLTLMLVLGHATPHRPEEVKRRTSGIPDDTGGGGTPRVKAGGRHGSGDGNTFIGAMPGGLAPITMTVKARGPCETTKGRGEGGRMDRDISAAVHEALASDPLGGAAAIKAEDYNMKKQSNAPKHPHDKKTKAA